jgi:hypothetical protein
MSAYTFIPRQKFGVLEASKATINDNFLQRFLRMLPSLYVNKLSKICQILKANGYIVLCNTVINASQTGKCHILSKISKQSIGPPLEPRVVSTPSLVTIINIISTISSAILLPDPILMVRTHISMPTNPKLPSNINIPLPIKRPRFTNLLDHISIALPRGSAKDTLHLSRFTLSPLLKTSPVDILATSSFAPEDIFWFIGLLELHDADGAVAFNWLASAACVCLLGGCCIS